MLVLEDLLMPWFAQFIPDTLVFQLRFLKLFNLDFCILFEERLEAHVLLNQPHERMYFSVTL